MPDGMKNMAVSIVLIVSPWDTLSGKKVCWASVVYQVLEVLLWQLKFKV
ncbi:MAG TPA: hypothetical protein IAA58_09795 [Candidatus Gallacutalibacter stercoravium]|nr:hypothetical protein [Candidatus Gallacutalibacter stercoravium]